MGGLSLKAHLIELDDTQQRIVAGVAKVRGLSEARVIELIIHAFLHECEQQLAENQ